MKNEKQYDIKLHNGQIWRFIHDSELGILAYPYENDHWSKPEVVSKDGTRHFSVYLDSKDQIYVFCQKRSGDIVYYQIQQSQWIESTILHSKTGKLYPIHFEAVQSRNQLHLFYNILDTKSNHHVLIHQWQQENTEWTAPTVVDQICPMTPLPFTLHKDWHSNVLLVYQVYKSDYQFGTRKYSLYYEKWEDFDVCDHTLYPYVDYDSLLSSQYLHMVSIKSDKSENTLLYQRKGKTWDKPLTLFAHSKVDSCNLFFSKYTLHISWICDGKIYLSTSIDQGKTFTKPTVQGKVMQIPEKLIYQSNYPERVHGKHLYIDTDQSFNQLLYSNILPVEMTEKKDSFEDHKNQKIVRETPLADSSQADRQEHSTSEKDTLDSVPAPSIDTILHNLHTSFDSSKKVLLELESAFQSTTHMYQNKSIEINKLTAQLGILQNRNEALMKKNEELRHKNKELQDKLVAQIKETKGLESQIIKNEHIIEYLKKEVELRKAPLIITAEDPRKRNKNSLVKRFLIGDDVESQIEE